MDKNIIKHKIGYRVIYQKNIKTALLEAKRNNFGVLEIHLQAPQFLPDCYSNKDLADLKLCAKKLGVIIQIHTPLEFSLIFTTKELREGIKKYLKKIIGFSSKIGARCITLHPGSPGTYHLATGEKIKDNDKFPEFYADLLDDSLKYITSIAPKNLFICFENTDNFNLSYQRVLQKYLKSGKIFLTWDVRKNYTYDDNKLIKDQWDFVVKNKKYVKNIHVSGFNDAHGFLEGSEDKISKALDLFYDLDVPIIIEILPVSYALKAKKTLLKILKGNS